LIDLHCHILPGVDDGPSTVEESLSMARQALADGIQTMVATPHTLNEIYDNPASEVTARVSRLQDRFRKEKLALNLCPGSDAHICVQMASRIMAGDAATINNSGRYVLVEFPVQAIPSGYREELFQLKLQGITPIITHPERNLVFQNRLDIIYSLVEMGCLIQITAMSVTGEFGEEAMAYSHRLLDFRLAHIIATDGHSPENRPPVLSPAVEVAARIMGSMAAAKEMVVARPEAVLAGKSVEPPEPKRPSKRKWWFR